MGSHHENSTFYFSKELKNTEQLGDSPDSGDSKNICIVGVLKQFGGTMAENRWPILAKNGEKCDFSVLGGGIVQNFSEVQTVN